MSADLLRRAATALREHAEAATPGPWEHADHGLHGTYMGCGEVFTMDPDLMGGNIAAPSGDLYPRSGYSPRDDMAYIALMSPPVALALAELLDEVVMVQEGHHLDDHTPRYADALARAILRKASDA